VGILVEWAVLLLLEALKPLVGDPRQSQWT